MKPAKLCAPQGELPHVPEQGKGTVLLCQPLVVSILVVQAKTLYSLAQGTASQGASTLLLLSGKIALRQQHCSAGCLLAARTGTWHTLRATVSR